MLPGNDYQDRGIDLDLVQCLEHSAQSLLLGEIEQVSAVWCSQDQREWVWVVRHRDGSYRQISALRGYAGWHEETQPPEILAVTTAQDAAAHSNSDIAAALAEQVTSGVKALTWREKSLVPDEEPAPKGRKKKAEEKYVDPVWNVHHEMPKRLAATLSQITASEGVWPMDVFKDFLEITEIVLDSLPDHFNSLAHTGYVAEDPPQVQEKWQQIVKRYHNPRQVFERFSEAFALIVKNTMYDDGTYTYADLLGGTYMEFVPSHGQNSRGQYFTPFNVAQASAIMLLEFSAIPELEQRIDAAIDASTEPAVVLYRLLCPPPENAGDDALKAYKDRRRELMLPAVVGDVDPLRVLDPCVGSGILLLAAASVVPRQYIELGLVTFYGIDIDAGCCQMTRINTRLYGLNRMGYYLVSDDLPHDYTPAGAIIDVTSIDDPAELNALPEPWRSEYAPIVEAKTPEEKEAAIAVVVEHRATQLQLFEMPANDQPRLVVNKNGKKGKQPQPIPVEQQPLLVDANKNG